MTDFMGYFSNGTEWERYEAEYCWKCIHNEEEKGCAVVLAHMLFNYDECNNEKSILNFLIPRSKDKLSNEQCMMFMEGKNVELATPPIPPFNRMTPERIEWLRKQPGYAEV